jgi:UDP-2,3-diacylglucosamine hydrolase
MESSTLIVKQPVRQSEAVSSCYFVSDLHLLSSRSNAAEYHDAIVRAAASASDLVLGGDIFDFHWSRTATLGHALDHAIRWLDDLAVDAPNCRFHYVLGNHDHVPSWMRRLDELATRDPNFAWHEYYLRIGTAMFLHGDIVDRDMAAEELALARRSRPHTRRAGRVRNWFYDVAVATRIHVPIPHLRHRKQIMARRILKYIEEIGYGRETGIRNVYFGHTHLPMSDYVYQGVAFHNGGASIRGNPFHILRTDTQA